MLLGRSEEAWEGPLSLGVSQILQRPSLPCASGLKPYHAKLLFFFLIFFLFKYS